jgi:prophage maintenance system killer protein
MEESGVLVGRVYFGHIFYACARRTGLAAPVKFVSLNTGGMDGRMEGWMDSKRGV